MKGQGYYDPTKKKKKHIDEHTKDSTEHEIKLKNKPENKRTE